MAKVKEKVKAKAMAKVRAMAKAMATATVKAMDRAAMIIASQNLGHNREDVVGEHYLKLQ